MKFILSLFILFFLYDLNAITRMGIISSASYCGEREVGQRMKIAGENLGWQVFLDENEGRDLASVPDLDFVICLLPKNDYFYPNCTNYLTIFHPFNYLDATGKLLKFYEKYDGYLLTISKPEKFDLFFRIRKKKLFTLPFYPTLQSIPYNKSPLNSLMAMVPVWGNRRSDPKFLSLYELLDRSGFTQFYGSQRNALFTPNKYRGSIPFDGTSVIAILQQHGIVLVFHSDIHNHAGIPSARIFEAAASSCVIISDENPFVKKHFGDSVFYVDTSLSADALYQSICDHMETIASNPEKALQMAKQAHQIYKSNFLMENQLLQLEELDKTVKASIPKFQH